MESVADFACLVDSAFNPSCSDSFPEDLLECFPLPPASPEKQKRILESPSKGAAKTLRRLSLNKIKAYFSQSSSRIPRQNATSGVDRSSRLAFPYDSPVESFTPLDSCKSTWSNDMSYQRRHSESSPNLYQRASLHRRPTLLDPPRLETETTDIRLDVRIPSSPASSSGPLTPASDVTPNHLILAKDSQTSSRSPPSLCSSTFGWSDTSSRNATPPAFWSLPPHGHSKGRKRSPSDPSCGPLLRVGRYISLPASSPVRIRPVTMSPDKRSTHSEKPVLAGSPKAHPGDTSAWWADDSLTFDTCEKPWDIDTDDDGNNTLLSSPSSSMHFNEALEIRASLSGYLLDCAFERKRWLDSHDELPDEKNMYPAYDLDSTTHELSAEDFYTPRSSLSDY